MTALRQTALTEESQEFSRRKPSTDRRLAPAFQPLSAARMRSWYDEIADDALLSAMAHRAARKVGDQIVLGNGFGEISGQELANRLRCCLRTAQSALTELIDRNHLGKETRRGRGLKNRYWPITKR